jgi:hypothetical protein
MNLKTFPLLLCAATFAVLSTVSARANVYATDIKINGSLTNAIAANGSPVAITYRLNQTADLGVTVNILQTTNLVASIAGGTNMGLNAVSWTPSANGAYSVSITAAASGFPVWQQISVDTNAGMPAYFPVGIAVDNNSNSPYYGRVIMSCATHNGTPTSPTNYAQTGLYKMNSDGSQADEGWYGNANYLADDGGDGPVMGQMPDSGNGSTTGYDPMKIRIGDDDRIYWVDNSYYGAVIACDMQATTNQVVVCEGAAADIGAGDVGPSWWGMEDVSCCDWAGGIGFQEFDITGVLTSNAAALWLCDNDYGNGPNNWGVWMFRMKNGVVDTNDTTGTQVVFAGSTSDLSLVSSGGCTVDTNLDIFVGQSRNNEDAVYDAMAFPNYNGGVLPPENSGQTLSAEFGFARNEVQWGYGCGVDTMCDTNPSFEAVSDTVINSRTSPTIVACPMDEGSQFVLGTTGGGIRLFNATTGSILTVTNTNGMVLQTLTNLDNGQAYRCAAWDNVGNLYGASTTRQLWRVYSPPGTSTNTTVAVAQIQVGGATAPIEITSITAVPSGSGCASVTITFSATANLPPAAFMLVGAPTLNGPFTPVTRVNITGGSGIYQASFLNCSTEFFEIEQP